MRALIVDLILIAALAQPLAAAEPAHALRQSTGGLLFHYGVVPAEIIAKHSAEHPERTMHGGRGGGSHIVLALFDAGSGARIAEARVEATVERIGGTSVRKRLEPMEIAGSASFGNYFSLETPGAYRILFRVERTGESPVTAVFEYRVAPPARRR